MSRKGFFCKNFLFSTKEPAAPAFANGGAPGVRPPAPACPKPGQPQPLRQSRSRCRSHPARHLVHRSSPLIHAHLRGAKGSIVTEKEIATGTPSDSPPKGCEAGGDQGGERGGEGRGRTGSPCYRKALIQIIKTLSCYEQAGGRSGGVGGLRWPVGPGGCRGARPGNGGGGGGHRRQGERGQEKRKVFQPGLSTPPAPNSQLLSDAISISPDTHALLTTAAAGGGGKGPR